MNLRTFRPAATRMAACIALAAAASLFTAPNAGAAGSEAPRIHLKGTPRIDAHVGRASDEPFLSGTVTDDTGRSVPKASVRLQIASASAGGVTDVVLSSAAPAACHDGEPRPVLDSAKRILLVTDDAGRFCVRLALPTQRYLAHFETPASKLLVAATFDLSFDLALESLTLRFDPAPTVFSLDDAETTLDVAATSGNEDAPFAAGGLALRLSNESGALVGEAVTTASGRAHFVVPSVRLGPPGDGELRVVFDGTRAIEGTARGQAIERRTGVSLVVTDAVAGKLPAASPEEGIGIDVVARLACSVRGCAGVPTGAIEMHVGNVLVTAAPLRRGAAHLTTAFRVPGTEDVNLRVSYRPDGPWFQVTEDTSLLQPVRSARPWGKLAMALAGVGVAGWVCVPRWPSRRLRRGRTPAPLPRAPEWEGVLARRPLTNASSRGWTGRVIDAHEGTPIGGAQVRIERPGFQNTEVIVEVASVDDGTFALPSIETIGGDQLVVSSPIYAPLRRSLPTFGHLDVGMVQRKRALLGRLVRWATERGGRFDAKPEPTPAHVRSAAGPGSPIAGWADAVEKAIYGGAVIDARTQSEIDRLNPDAAEGDTSKSAPPGGRPAR